MPTPNSTTPWHRVTDLSLDRRGAVATRRDFLRWTGAGVGAAAMGFGGDVSLAAEALRRGAKRCVLLYMEGAPSQLETLDPKPDSPRAGSAGAIPTITPGVHLSENLPHLAGMTDRLTLVRSLTGKEGSHPRAQFLMHHGHLPMGADDLPTLGANVAERLVAEGLADAAHELPSFVRVGGRNASYGNAGMLGVEYDPLVVDDPAKPPRNARPATTVERYRRRLDLLSKLDHDFARREGTDVVARRRELARSASEMILSPAMRAFDLSEEPAKVREAYGEGRFAAGCLLARRLLEAGVPFVEVTQNGWDTHQDNHARVAELASKTDRPAARLLAELDERGLLDTTLVVWMGEFGRTPKINARGGRDHYPKAFSAWLAGCGIARGKVIGATDADGREVIERPVTPADLLRTAYHALGLDASHENETRGGRPVALVDGGEVIEEAFG